MNWRYTRFRAHFAFERRVAPVAHVLQDQQANHDIHRGAAPSARAAVCPSARQRFVRSIQQHRIVQHGVDVPHPVFPQLAHFLGDEAVAEVELATAELDHLRPLARDLARWALAASLWLPSSYSRRWRLSSAICNASSLNRSHAA